MLFADTYLVTDKLETYSHTEVDAAEAQLNTVFPAGYREYVTTLGKGQYCDYVNVSPPQEIVENQLGAKLPLEEFCHSWDGTEFDITPARLAKAILIANSIDGDWVVFEPALPEVVYVLPESEDVIYKAGPTLKDALEWLQKPRSSSEFRYFNSAIDQKREPVPSNLRLSLDSFRDELVAVGQHDHLEEFWNDNPGVSLDMYAALKMRMDMVVPELGEITAFYRSFGGYVRASAMSSSGVWVEFVHDADQSSETLIEIMSYLQSKAA